MTLIKPALRPAKRILYLTPRWSRCFASTPKNEAKNRIYTNVRSPPEFHDLLLLSARRPLITLWTANWCPSCNDVAPVLKELIEDGVGEDVGGVGYVQVEDDAMTIGDLPFTYRINSMPTLMAFSRQEAQFDTKVTRVEDMKNRGFLTEWIEKEARRGGSGGGGGSLFGNWFGS
ncbi:hypothetical protein K490DRAFT_69889 [Saccharata proteae CBS 121410]|uniref:Thioredoxin domain-containing protein n=1 Tax=Saccharata proteae CBS 121410 TaxID=1314787 RepID=A0A9P4LRA3_9PEZI|nr:hypothetical protein K490DRAFT_69889 [Saccharata proteae CBS 121410]